MHHQSLTRVVPTGPGTGQSTLFTLPLLAADVSCLLLSASAETKVTAPAGSWLSTCCAAHLVHPSVPCFVFQSWAEIGILCVLWENLQATVKDLGGCQINPAGVKRAMDCRCGDSQAMENHFTRMEENNSHPGVDSKPQHPVHDPECPREAPWGSGEDVRGGGFSRCSCKPWCCAWRAALSTKSFMRIPGPKQ